MMKYLPILHVKIVLSLSSFIGIVDGLQSSSLTINVQLGLSQDFDWASQEHLFSSYSATPEWLYLFIQIIVLMKCESLSQFQIHG